MMWDDAPGVSTKMPSAGLVWIDQVHEDIRTQLVKILNDGFPGRDITVVWAGVSTLRVAIRHSTLAFWEYSWKRNEDKEDFKRRVMEDVCPEILEATEI